MDKDKTEKVVNKFIKLTNAGELKWQEVQETAPLHMGSSSIIKQAFTTTYDDKRIVIYEYSYRDMDEHEREYWDSEIAIAITDGQYSPILPFPRVPGRWGLFEAVRDDVLGADDILDSILKG